MLRVFDFSKKNIGVFHDYNALLGFITAEENRKLLEDHPSFGKGYWAFAEYTPEKLRDVCAWIKPGYLTTVQIKSLEQKMGLLEICRGDSAALREIPVTPELDIEEFKKKFCLDYCRNRQWRLIEVLDHKPSPINLGEYYIDHPYTRQSRLSRKSLENTQGRRMKADLDCCIERLRQQPVAAKFISAPASTKKGEF